MFQKRTDLALEIHELRGEKSGISISETEKDGIRITTATVGVGEGEKLSGKNAGKYITLEIGNLRRADKTRFEFIAEVVAEEISKLLPKKNGCILVAGLGNENITPDSLGPKTVRNLLVTRHIEDLDPTLFKDAGFGCVAAMSPGVLGQTGIESAEIIKSVCQSIKPKCVVVIDSLASRRLSRLATTVQLSDGGISPGSGVSNKRAELSEKTLGIPVVSIGVPTVVDAATLAYDILEEHFGETEENFSSVLENLFSGEAKNMFVTPKDTDVIAAETAKLLSSSINIAIHNMKISEISEYLN